VHEHDVSRQLLNYDLDAALINSDLHEADLHSLSDFISDDKTLTRDDDEFSDPPDDKSETKIINLTNDVSSPNLLLINPFLLKRPQGLSRNNVKIVMIILPGRDSHHNVGREKNSSNSHRKSFN